MNIKIAFSGLLILLIGFAFNSLKLKDQQVASPLRSSAPGMGTLSRLQRPFFPIYNFHSENKEFQVIDRKVERFMQQWRLVGCALAIVKDERLVYARGFGFADREKKISAQPFHQFRIASVSKLFTAIAIMHLVEAGKIRLEDPVFGPEGILNDSIFLDIADPLAYKIEVQHLLRHTGGWRNQLRRDPMFAPQAVAQIMEVSSPPSLDKVIQFMLSQTGYFEPGSLYDYSNFGYCVLGKIIEKKTGMLYESYLQQHILAPMGIHKMQMTSNTYEQKHSLEVKYYEHEKAKKNISIYNPQDSASRAYEGTDTQGLGAAGGWTASVLDLMRFLVRIDGFHHQADFLKPESIAKMTQAPLGDSTGRWALGWKDVNSEKWWRTGSLACSAISLSRRSDGMSWVFVTNTGTWRGPFFSYEIEGMMERLIPKIKKWPDWDLFELLPGLERDFSPDFAKNPGRNP